VSVICALDRGSRAGLSTPALGSAEQPEWKLPRVEMALVAGYHPVGQKTNWTVVGRHGGPVLLLTHARLFPCSPPGVKAAREACEKLRDEHCPGAVHFTARVVVSDEPEDAVEAWRFEGSEPRSIGRYPFE